MQSLRRIIYATLIAVPSTAVAAAALLLVPPNIALGATIFGIALFATGKSTNRPIPMAVGGVVMFAGVFAWAVRQ